MASSTQRDEFDELAEQGGPVGVHRAPRSTGSRIVPVIIAFVLAGALAWGVATYFWNQDGFFNFLPWAQEEPVASPTPTPAFSPTPSPTPTGEPSPSPEPEPEPVVVYDAPVAVLNASGIAGLAGTSQATLQDAGFTNVTADNITENLPESNTVFYSSEDQAATAQEIGERLGITNVVLGTPPGGGSIEVVLRSNPQG